jgi:hypothetical protein
MSVDGCGILCAAHNPIKLPIICSIKRSTAVTWNAVLHVPGGSVKTLSGPETRK